jgi:KRAB domain-containing zinc finger protein
MVATEEHPLDESLDTILTTPESKAGLVKKSTEKSTLNSSRICPSDSCGFATTVPAELKEHIRTAHDSRPFTCKKCGITFKLNAHLRTHDTEVHLGIRPHVCESCGFSFARKGNLIKHQKHNACQTGGGSKQPKVVGSQVRQVRDHHSGAAASHGSSLPAYFSKEKESPETTEEDKYLCDRCDKSFKYRQSLQYHIESIHMDKKDFACHICGRAFTRMQRLREHSARMHGDGLVQPSHTCDECGRDFITSGAWKLHMRKFHSVHITEEQEEEEETKLNLTGESGAEQQRRRPPDLIPIPVRSS